MPHHQTQPRTANRRQPKKGSERRKKPSDLKGKIAIDPRLFTVEVGSAQQKGRFEIAIYGSKDAARPQGMSKLYHRPSFQSFEGAAAALVEELRKSTEVKDTRFTISHLHIVETKLAHAARSISLPLREVVKAT